MYVWDCERPPIHPSVSPLPSFAVRPPTRRREDEAKSDEAKSDWIKQVAQRLQAIQGHAVTKKPE